MTAPASKDTRPAEFVLDRADAVPALIGRFDDFLIVAGLAGTARELKAHTDGAPNLFALAGVMGAAVTMGLGLALAQPERRVLVATGDGELLMNIGSLATVALMAPANLSILCVDNGHYGETGYQLSHSSRGVDLAEMAAGAGIPATAVVQSTADYETGRRLLRAGNGPTFVLLRVKPTDPPSGKFSLDAVAARIAFRSALLGSR
ncbi:MAG: aldehyde dehydrogenase [Hyphomicrobiaceae bacterium]|nr:aldehyde dehydrogenase [Hyphomicrobiaceae bacterium]